jgi:glycerophosphoryl diester phosphodiesterase
VTLVFAHRGACSDAPENTLQAFELAIEQQADYIELDVRTTRDGTPYVCHDPLRGDAPASIQTLDATLEALRGKLGLALEPKDATAMRGVLAALRAHRVPAAEVVVLSLRVRHLEHARRERPDLRYVLLLGCRRPDPTAAARFWGVGFEDETARPRRIALAHSLGLATLVFTVNDPARMRELASLGVTGILTDRPALALAEVREATVAPR